MPDPPIRLRDAHQFCCFERLLVELERAGRILDAQIRRDGVTTLGNCLG